MHRKTLTLALLVFLIPGIFQTSRAETRKLVELPDMMRTHMLANMRDHLAAFNEILNHLAEEELEKAADIAESRLGFSSLESHGASHMAPFMPEEMSVAGTKMHRAASQFARIAQEGEALPAYRKLGEITAACVECHAAYRVQ